jgi:2-C-methyl-D-erythritol 4-phosphate cytidylyltransferase/2-C-methyl-D-erythritol 2,4-cyclodiphosphate synthase
MCSFKPYSAQQSTMPFSVLIAAAGSGQRVGGNIPKQYQYIGSKTILRHTLEKFLKLPEIRHIQVVIDQAHLDLYQKATEGLDLPPPVFGAETRKKSIMRGLEALTNMKADDIVMVHDAARPLIDTGDILNLALALENNRAVTLCRPMTDTILNDENGMAGDVLDRTHLRAIETPQGFRYQDLMDAHIRFANEDRFTDDASLVSAFGIDVKLIASGHPNFKITNPEDLAMAEKLLNPKTQSRIGQGFDVHAFDAPGSSQSIRLGGIDIPFGQKLMGHSDADVVLHAITDALLGAIGKGDIGDYFPPSDMQFKNMDSAVFLEKARDMVLEFGATINNIDVTIICEEPKIGPHKDKMIRRIASVLNLEPQQIGIKATTTEGLGFTGRREGIATQAIASVSVHA